MSDFDDDEGGSSLVELKVVKPRARTLISRIENIAKGGSRSGALLITELLGVLQFTNGDKAALKKARRPVSIQFENAESGKFTSRGSLIKIEKIPGLSFSVSLTLNREVTGDLKLSKNSLSLINIKGIQAKKWGIKIKIEKITITPGNVAIY